MSDTAFTLLAAVEVADGETAIVDRGRIKADREFGDAVADAQAWVEQGAEWLHLADLQANDGERPNRKLLEQVARAVRGRARIEVAGGLRDDRSVTWARKLGADRVVLDLNADPAWLAAQYQRLGHRCAVQLPLSKGLVAAPGTTYHGMTAVMAATALAAQGCPGLLVRDVRRAGTRKGPDVELIDAIADATEVPLVVSGGIAKLEHLHALAAVAERGVSGAVLDVALYRKFFSVAEAMAAVAPRYDPYQWGPAQPWGMTQGL